LTLGIQLEKDSLTKSLKSQSSLGSCCSLAPQQVSQMFKWARDLSWTRWRSINTPHKVQRSVNRFPQKTGSPDAVDVAPDALHRASGDTSTANCTWSDRSPDAISQRPVAPSDAPGSFTNSLSLRPDATWCVRCWRPVLGAGLQPPWVWDWTLPGESGASVRCLTLSTKTFQRLRTSPDALTESPVQRPVPSWAH